MQGLPLHSGPSFVREPLLGSFKPQLVLAAASPHAIGSCVAFEQADLTQNLNQSVEEDSILMHLWGFSSEDIIFYQDFTGNNKHLPKQSYSRPFLDSIMCPRQIRAVTQHFSKATFVEFLRFTEQLLFLNVASSKQITLHPKSFISTHNKPQSTLLAWFLYSMGLWEHYVM